MPKMEDLHTGVMPTWCPGCGDFGVWQAFKHACVEGGWDMTNTALVAGIGCHGHIVNYVKMVFFEGLHGRDLPVASAIKMANKDLRVISFGGDGNTFAEGGNHFMHAARRNHDITLFLHDNAVYGLTTGQTSPRSPHGYESKTTPQGNPDEPVNPLALAITMGATWVGRAYAGDIPSLTKMMMAASDHKGFSLLQILQPCVTFNKVYTHQYFRKNSYWLGEDYDRHNKAGAWQKAWEWGENSIAFGVFYEEERETYEDLVPALKEGGALVKRTVEKRDLSGVLGRYG